jgi:hypothetical protein
MPLQELASRKVHEVPGVHLTQLASTPTRGGWTAFTKRFQFGAEVVFTEPSLLFFELKSVDATAARWGLRCRIY